MYTKNCPDQVHVCVKTTKTELQKLESSEHVVIGGVGELGCAKAGVGKLIVDAGDRMVFKICF